VDHTNVSAVFGPPRVDLSFPSMRSHTQASMCCSVSCLTSRKRPFASHSAAASLSRRALHIRCSGVIAGRGNEAESLIPLSLMQSDLLSSSREDPRTKICTWGIVSAFVGVDNQHGRYHRTWQRYICRLGPGAQHAWNMEHI